MNKSIKNSKKVPIVSICCITYNHAPFIRRCLDGFLMQQDVDYEVLIHDDCSTDGTQEILKEYAERYPNIIFPIFEKENLYSKGLAGSMDVTFNFNRAKGTFIATCEGDDYWIDPMKLKKQIMFMDANPAYSVCFHGYRNKYPDGQISDVLPEALWSKVVVDGGIDVDLNLYFQKWITMPLTMLFRKEMYDMEWHKQYKYYRDMHEIYHLIRVGKCRILPFEGAIRNVHQGGISSMLTNAQYCDISLPIDKEFYYVNRDVYSKANYKGTLELCCNTYKRTNKLKAISMCLEYGKISGYWRHAFDMLINVFKR